MADGSKRPWYVLSYGGGVNTVALMILVIERKLPLDEVVFADTGNEVPETYAHIPVTRAYLEGQGIPFRVVTKKNGKSLYQASWDRRVIPSAMWRWSTREFKIRPIYAYYRSLATHVNQYMGIAYDEWHRMKDSLVSYVTNLFPLVEWKMTRQDCVQVIQKAGMPVPVKSGCYFCPFNSLERWKWLLENHPDLFEKAVVLEEHSKHFPRQRLTDQVYRHRASVTLRELWDRIAEGEHVRIDEAAALCGGECMT